jgi:hypothetical protein
VTDVTITILFVSALVGLTTGIFILIARLFLGRPVVTITPSKHTGDLRFQNRSKHAIVLLSIHSLAALGLDRARQYARRYCCGRRASDFQRRLTTLGDSQFLDCYPTRRVVGPKKE